MFFLRKYYHHLKKKFSKKKSVVQIPKCIVYNLIISCLLLKENIVGCWLVQRPICNNISKRYSITSNIKKILFKKKLQNFKFEVLKSETLYLKFYYSKPQI